MMQHHTRLTRLARQAMRRGDSAEAARWMRAAALAQPPAARVKEPVSIDAESQVDKYAEERQQVREKLQGLLVRLERESAECERQAALNAAETNSC